MMEKYYQIAGMVLKVSGEEDELYLQDDFLAPFSVEKQDFQWEYHTRTVDELPDPVGECIYAGSARRVFASEDGVRSYIGIVSQSERDGYIFLHRRNARTDILVKRSQIPDRISEKTLLKGMELEHLLAVHHALLLHASCISCYGGAVLFTAPSGGGKSTQAALWEKHRGAAVINGDRIVIRRDEAVFKAWGVPFSGTSGISNQACIPIRAIVYLKKAPATVVRRLKGTEAFRKVWEGCTVQQWEREDTENGVSCLSDLIANVPMYELACTADESAVLALERAMANHI